MRMSNVAKNNLHAHFWPDFGIGGDSFVSIELTKTMSFSKSPQRARNGGLCLPTISLHGCAGPTGGRYFRSKVYSGVPNTPYSVCTNDFGTCARLRERGTSESVSGRHGAVRARGQTIPDVLEFTSGRARGANTALPYSDPTPGRLEATLPSHRVGLL